MKVEDTNKMLFRKNSKERQIKWDGYHKYRKALKKIKIPKNCSVCGVDTKIFGHHSDYKKYLDVIWLCGTCHARLHSQIRRLQSKYLKTRQKEYTKKDFNNDSKVFNRFRKVFIKHFEKLSKIK